MRERESAEIVSQGQMNRWPHPGPVLPKGLTPRGASCLDLPLKKKKKTTNTFFFKREKNMVKVFRLKNEKDTLKWFCKDNKKRASHLDPGLRSRE